MAIESDAQGDLELDAVDAENVEGGRAVRKASKPNHPAHPLVEPEADEPKRSLEGLEHS
jgi:hypothetical protein